MSIRLGGVVCAAHGVVVEAGEGVAGAVGFFQRGDHDVGAGGDLFDQVPGVGRGQIERQRLFGLVVEEVSEGAFTAGDAVDPGADAADAVAGG